MAFENSRKLTWKQNRHKILVDECNQLKVVTPDLNPPSFQSPSQCNMVSVAATRALNDWAPPSPQRYHHQHHDCDRHHRYDWTAPRPYHHHGGYCQPPPFVDKWPANGERRADLRLMLLRFLFVFEKWGTKFDPSYMHIWLNCYCWGNSSIPEGRFSKWF